jgi:hypothetical protein
VAQTLSYNSPIDTIKVSNYLNGEIKKGVVIGYAFITFEARSYPFITSSRFSSLSYFPTISVGVYGLTQNYLDVSYNQYLLYTEVDPAFKYKQTQNGLNDVIDSLYTNEGQAIVDGEKIGNFSLKKGFYPGNTFSGRYLGLNINDTVFFDPTLKYKEYLDVIMSEALRYSISVNVKSPLQIQFNAYNPKTKVSYTQAFIAKSRAMVFLFLNYRFINYQDFFLIHIDYQQVYFYLII